MYIYYIPIVIGLGGIIWFYLSKPSKPTPAKPNPITPVQNKPKVSPSTPVKKAPKKKEVSDGRPVKIFYGSQTGTAEDFSHKLAAEGKKYGFAPEVVDMEEYDMEELHSESFVIIVIATYGEGEPTDNARQFDDWITEDSRSPDELKGVKFTVFGLGNKTYEKYNYMGRKFDKRLEELGAERIYKKGEGDDDGSLEDDFAAWKRDMWPGVCEHFGMPIPEVDSNPGERRFRVDTFTRDSPEGEQAEKFAKIHIAKKNAQKEGGTPDIKNPYLAKLVVNRELHAVGSDRSCRHIEFEIGDALKYEVGDHLGVFPENDPEVVEAAAKRLNAPLDAVIAMYPIEAKGTVKAVVGPCTVRKALSQYSDLSGSPRKGFLRVLATYASDPQEKKKLLELSDDKSPQPYQSFIKDDQRTVLCVLNDFPSVDIPFDHFLEAAPKMSPRMYSISSSLREHPGRVHITAVVVNYVTPTKRTHKGVTTTWLARAIPKDDESILVPVFIEKSSFRLPKDPLTPVLMVGPGTGLAPFRGFIQERKHQHSKGQVGESVLFFGCRGDVDYIYADELKEATSTGYLSKLFVAFSRMDQQKKVYVQHKMHDYSDGIYNLLHEQKGYLYICGDARAMAKDVHSSIIQILTKHGNKTEEQAEQFLTELKQSGRYLTDTWF